MKKYEYMIVYACPGMTGRCSISTDILINSYDKLTEIEVIVRRQLNKLDLVIIDFKLLREFTEESEEETLSKDQWIPISSGIYPKNEDNVQITYITIFDQNSHPWCDEFAYWDGSKWHWTDGSEITTCKVTAWRQGEPYREE